MLAAVTFLFIIQRPAATGVNIVNMIIVNCLTINFIFSFTNKYINIAITRAVAIAFPVEMDVSILSPNLSPKLALFEAFNNRYTILLFKNNINRINIGARAIATPPKQSLIKLSFASFFLAVFIPATIIL